MRLHILNSIFTGSRFPFFSAGPVPLRVNTVFAFFLIAFVGYPKSGFAQAPFTGTYLQNFDAMGTGSAIPAGWSMEPKEGLRYKLSNDYYFFADGIVLYSMIRHFKPSSIIEIGSGFSSALMLDMNDLFPAAPIQLNFVEPYPERLNALLRDTDRLKANVIEKVVQEVDSSFFERLKKNDILFVDSSHIAKTGSDLNYILFEILPVLKPGVLIHFHDIFYPSEYPRDWVY
jgi:hypothetical protein